MRKTLLWLIAVVMTAQANAENYRDMEPLKLETPEMKAELVEVPAPPLTTHFDMTGAWKPDFNFFKQKTNPGVKPYKYVLRALAVPAGHHKIEFVFDPLSLKITETIATISFIIMVLAALAIIGLEGRGYLKRRRTTNQA